MQFALPLLILIAAFGALLFMFSIIGRHEASTRKWVGLILILAMVVLWVFKSYTWLTAGSVVSFIYFLTYPGILGRRIRGVALLLGVVCGGLLLATVPMAFAFMVVPNPFNSGLSVAACLVPFLSGAYFLRKRVPYLVDLALQMIRNAPVRPPA